MRLRLPVPVPGLGVTVTQAEVPVHRLEFCMRPDARNPGLRPTSPGADGWGPGGPPGQRPG